MKATTSEWGQPSRIRRQHVVSRFYLRGFADARNQLRRVALPGTHSHLVSVNDAMVIKDFYTIDLGDGGLSDFFERKFARLEQPAAEAMKIVRDGQWPLSPRGKIDLAAWIGLQYLRSEGVRNHQAQMQAQMIRLLVGASGKAALREVIEGAEGVAISDERLDAEWADLTKPGGPDLIPSVREHVRTMVEMLPPTTLMLSSLQWSLNVFQRKTLVTCDHPVVLLPGPDQPRWRGVGLANAGGYALALSRRLGLVIGASNDLPDLKVPGTSKLALSLNGHIAINARHSIFHHPGDADLLSAFELPDRRTREIGPVNDDHFIREEGLFAGMSKDQLQGLASPFSDRDEGMTIDDLSWPIPGRRFQWPPGSPEQAAAT